ncbi:hypothetical protein NKR23_g1507 [Pleurostoma richardsiae]|uniref:Bacteriophage T5 Orf172 DNA-binding domain-containing protein n=1 Tax=Pleurostoma richardsiae TaxID=41990 RepID=A0AA38VWI1_9PEZI|nr:hypothetical protein NKR23_g1507 [Pleurostoma richardsiae]
MNQPHTPPYTGGSDSDSSPPFQNTRSKQGKEVQRRPLNSHIFVSYAGQQTTREINDEIKKVLTQPLSKDEKKVDGFIYGYTFPESHTVKSLDSQTADPLNPGSYIKVGYTNEVGRRMKQVKRNCGYEPRHLFTPLQAPHYKRLERIIHRQLRNGRQREQACPSCGTGHLEWFRNEDGSAEKVIRMWRDWVAMRPYDEEGRLEDVWARRLHMVDLNSEDCWRDFVDLRVTLGPKLPRKSEKGIRPTPEAKRAGYPYLGGFIPVYAEAAAWYGNAHGSIPLGMYVPCRG